MPPPLPDGPINRRVAILVSTIIRRIYKTHILSGP